MQAQGVNPSRYGLDRHGIQNINQAYWNLGTAALVENAIRRREGLLAAGGALAVRTGQYTGRSPQDKFIVRDPSTQDRVWWGDVNRPFEPARFDALYARLLAYLQGSDLYVQDCFVGADPAYRLPARVITEYAWHNLFVRQLFVRPDWTKTGEHEPCFTVIDVPKFHAYPELDGTRSEAFVVVHLAKGIVIIGGTSYAGEMKKSAFSFLNFLLPLQKVLPMHCSANVGSAGDVALFFGLSGTGKTTLSADPGRRLIGDDEHGWSERGVFNFEGGCYAKTIRLSAEEEPQIAAAIRFGAVLENVAIDPETRLIDYNDGSFTENTRAAFPATFIPNAVVPGVGGHPKNVFFLTSDAFGVLPPIARLSANQAMYHFLSGYTAKVAGTERGLGKEPVATFSACFGLPFLVMHPTVYAEMLGERLQRHGVTCWLVNTGWTGGPFGTGRRMSLPHTRLILRAALEGALNAVPTREHPIFGFEIPTSCPGVPSEMLSARQTWSDAEAYDRKALELASLFQKNFERFGNIPAAIREAGPRAAGEAASVGAA
ncbi:MAG TPA: phosphoenolpyruvate carboxykinase (ATP) [Candidatus Sulfotelmatobacter sp.]|nr:phosphoenolpyruvate carboxykinase (ATP) [Candidatus Sulfotelmatobacter sp.]